MSLVDLTSSDSGRAAFVVALVLATTMVVAVATVRTRGSRVPIPAAGLVVVIGALAGLWRADLLTGGFVAGEVLLFLGAVLAARAPWWGAGLAAVPGALVLAAATPSAAPDWAPAFVVIAVVVAVPLVAAFDVRSHRTGLGPLLLAVTALGVYVAVPDTEEAAAVVGAALPALLLAFPIPLASLGGPLAAVPVGLVVAAATAGGRGRPGAIVGGVACLGVLLLGPVLPDLRTRSSFPRRLVPIVLLGALQVVVVVVMARVAAAETGAVNAAVIAAATLAVAAVLVFVAARIAPVRK